MIGLIIGPPGAGKGSQTFFIAHTLGQKCISTGELFRAAYEQGTEIGIRAHDEYWGNEAGGNLVPDNETNEIVEEQVTKELVEKGFLLDGYPRTKEQAIFLDNLLEKFDARVGYVILLEIPDAESEKRMSGRVYCPKCKKNYNVYTEPKPKEDNICDACNVELKTRNDQDPHTIKNRIKIYHRDTEPIIDRYKARGIVHRIDAMQTIEQITNDIIKIYKTLGLYSSSASS